MIHLLGPVELSSQGKSLRLGSDKSRLVLASLTVEIGRPVSLDALIQRLWDDELPNNPRENLHSYVSRIRRALRSVRPAPRVAITQRAHTYTLEADPDSVDWLRYRRLVSWAESVSRSGDEARAVSHIHEAERLWRGTALAGLPGGWAESTRVSMEERRRSVTASRIAMDLRLERYFELVSELAALVEEQPGDETLVGQFMTACYGSGRQTDALRVFQRARQALRTEHGAEVGDELARIHQHILRRHPVSQLVRPGTEPSEGRATSPDNLPRHAPLVGRHPEMRRLHSAISDPGRTGSAIVVESISGMAGIGKSCLAVHAAHELKEHFPDGRLYLDLRAHTSPQNPVSTDSALTSLLRLLGVPAEAIPADTGERGALWRRELATRRVLVILDDARDPDQVRPLLPDAPSSLVLITSRSRMTGLSTVRSLTLDVLPRLDAIALFRKFAYGDGTPGSTTDERGTHACGDDGEDREDGTHRRGGPGDATEIGRIVHRCAYLPLAIEIAASRLTAHPSWTLKALGERLSRAPGRLVEIRDGYREIADAFAMSHQALNPEQKSAFRRLSVHPGPELSAQAAAVMIGCGLEEAERLLEDLLRCHLLQEPVPHRFRYHDLLGEYARTLYVSEERDDAGVPLARLLDFYIATGGCCDRLLHPSRQRVAPPPAAVQRSGVDPGISDPYEARRWLTAELSNLLAAEQYARSNGMPDRAALLADAVAGHLDAEAHWAEAVPLHRHAVAHWEETGDEFALCRALLNLGSALSSTAQYQEAGDAGRRALGLARSAVDAPAELEALRILGVLHWRQGENRTALSFHRRSLELCSVLGDTWTAARCRNNAAITLLYLGEWEEALVNFQEALHGFRESGDKRNLGKTLNNLGDLHRKMRNTETAQENYKEALRIARESGSRSDVAIPQANLAGLLVNTGSVEEGMNTYHLAITEFRALRDRKNESAALSGLGRAHFYRGERDIAVTYGHQALGIARDIGASDEEINALRLCGEIELASESWEAAAEHLSSALAMARHTGAHEERVQVEELLTRLHPGGPNREPSRGTGPA